MLPPQTQRDEGEGGLGTQMERVTQKGFPEEHLGRNESGELGIHSPDLIPTLPHQSSAGVPTGQI